MEKSMAFRGIQLWGPILLNSYETNDDNIRVLQSLNPPDGHTRYVDQISSNLSDDIQLEFFSWRGALLGKFDVFHIHWPEMLFRDSSRAKAALKRVCFSVLLRRLRLKGIPIVRTAHNIQPHEQMSAHERRLLQKLDAQTSLYIRLNPTTVLPVEANAVTILHGHYIDRFAEFSKESVAAGRILYFGLIRPYKGVDELIAAYGGADLPLSTLRIVGQPSSSALTGLIETSSVADPRISSRLEFVDDATLVREVSSAELVVLPYKQMHNSGAVLVALSLAKPVLVPRSPSNDALADEVGEDWVFRYDGDLTSAQLETALRVVQSTTRAAQPNLQGRDWGVVGERHSALYHQLLRERAGRRQTPR